MCVSSRDSTLTAADIVFLFSFFFFRKVSDREDVNKPSEASERTRDGRFIIIILRASSRTFLFWPLVRAVDA